jgi:hypothetical protein
MMMRFRGGGIGHKSTKDATQVFRDDLDPLDQKRKTALELTTVKSDDLDEKAISCAGTSSVNKASNTDYT